MALRDALKPVITTILLVAYAAYVVLGLILMIMGIYYNSSVVGSNTFVTLTACAGGFFMMVVGGLGVYGSLKKITLFMLICLILDICIFIFLLAACITGIFLANNISDPVGEAVQSQYCDDPRYSNHIHCKVVGEYDPMNSGITVRASNWLGVLELLDSEGGAPHSCQVFNDGVVSAILAVNAAAGTCAFSDCGTPECLAVEEATAANCECLDYIAPVEPAAEQEANCEALNGAECTEYAVAPTDCAQPAPTQSDAAATLANQWSAAVEGDTPSEPCTSYAGCNQTNTEGSCVATPPSDEVVRVHERAGRTQICPVGCLSVPEYAAVAEQAASCTALGSSAPTRDADCRPCSEGEGNAGLFGCSGAGDTTACDAVTALDDATACEAATNCVYMEELVCSVNLEDDDGTIYTQNSTGQPETRTDFITTATETSFTSHECAAFGAISGVSAYIDSNCVYSPAVQPETGQEANCTSAGTAGASMFPAAKEQAVGAENVGCDATTCETKGYFMGNCSAVREAFTVGDLTSGLEVSCNTCWDHWQYKVIDDIKGNLWPATIAIFALFTGIVVLVSINYFMIDNQNDDGFSPAGIPKILSLVLSGFVLLFGLIVVIAGAIIMSDLSDGCPEGQDCTNAANIGVILLGVFVILTGIASIVGTVMGKFVGMMILRIANLVFLLCSLFLLVCGIAFAVIAGALDETFKQYEDNFDSVRTQYESQDPGLCHGLDDQTCKEKIMNIAASSNNGVVILLGLICFSFLFVLFLTYEAVVILKGDDDDDDDDDDDGDEEDE